ncbi:hypothetical protein H6P81_021330 [Aristolochia fimbriata]|uniref:Protein TAR1 n=1 Tax=Aristolochia fimbriata TaxID=158543 RepID=A0AAV7DQ99_ARIFI|nr:hypothetical protein H6P81_021330 [Aristolochia fimbriata]
MGCTGVRRNCDSAPSGEPRRLSVFVFLDVFRTDPVRTRGKTNRCDMGLNLGGSWQQGHSATYNTRGPVDFVRPCGRRLRPRALGGGRPLAWGRQAAAKVAPGKTNLSHDGLNPAHVPYWWVNNPTLGEFCFTMIGRADIEGSKKQRRYERLGCHKPVIPCGNFYDTSSFKFRRCAAPAKLPTDNVFARISPGEALEQKEGQCPPPTNGISKIALKVVVFHFSPAETAPTYPTPLKSFHKVGLESSSTGSSFPLILPSPFPWLCSESAVRRGERPQRGVPDPSPARRATTSSRRRGAASSSPPTARRVGTGTPCPALEPILFRDLRIHFADFPCLHCSIDRGCSPWRPDAVMIRPGVGGTFGPPVFKGRRGRPDTTRRRGALPAAGPYLRLSRFRVGRLLNRKDNSSRPRPASRTPLTLPSTACVPICTGGRSARAFSARGFAAAARPSYSSRPGCCPDGGPQGDPPISFPCALRVWSPADSHTCQTPWSVFQDGSNGEPAGRRQARRCHEGTSVRSRATLLGHRDDVSAGGIIRPGLGRPRDPRRSTPRVERRTGSRRPAYDRGASPAPIRFPPDNFKHSLTLFSKSFSSFPRGTCSLSVSRRYLALDGIYRPIGAAFPNNPTRRQRLAVRQGPGTTGLSPSLAPHSMGLAPGPSQRTLLQTTIRTAKAARFSYWALPGSLAVTRGILVSFFSSAY